MTMIYEDIPLTGDYYDLLRYDPEDYVEDNSTEFLDWLNETLTSQLEEEGICLGWLKLVRDYAH